jgi:hypothetical protein
VYRRYYFSRKLNVSYGVMGGNPHRPDPESSPGRRRHSLDTCHVLNHYCPKSPNYIFIKDFTLVCFSAFRCNWRLFIRKRVYDSDLLSVGPTNFSLLWWRPRARQLNKFVPSCGRKDLLINPVNGFTVTYFMAKLKSVLHLKIKVVLSELLNGLIN